MGAPDSAGERAGLTTPEAAKYARRHQETLLKALAVGDLHGIQRKPRGPWTIKTACIDSYLAGEVCEHRRDNVVRFPGAARAARSS